MQSRDFESAMADVGRALVAAHVATRPLVKTNASELMESAAAWASEAALNNIPVARQGEIVGVLENINGDYGHLPVASRTGTARHAMRPLEAGMLLEASSPLSELVSVLLEPPHYRLIIDGPRIDAIVTPSDLVKLPMRVLVFGAVAHLESAMLDALRRVYGEDESALSSLAPDAQEQVLQRYEMLQEAKLEVPLLEVATLKQKARLLTARGVFGNDVAAVDAEFADLVVMLRNPVVHAAGFVDDSLDALRALDRRLRAVADRTRQAHDAGLPRSLRAGAVPGGASRPADCGFRVVHAPVMIPFEPRAPAVLAARQRVRDLIASVAAGPGELLHGVICARGAERTDLDNALLYNIGGHVATAARNGVILERGSASRIPGATYSYRLARHGDLVHHAAGATLARIPEVVLPRGLESWHRVWAATRSAVHVLGGEPGDGELLLELHVSVPGAQAANGAFVKTIVDGVLTALHAHGNHATAAAVAERMARHLDMPPHLIATHLLDPASSVLGTVPDLIVLRGDGVQCRPDDHRLSALQLTLTHAAPTWTLTGFLATAVPRDTSLST